MKINILFISSFFVCCSVFAQTREIIGSGFFSVNKTRNYSIAEDTEYYLDGNKIDETLFEIIGSGFQSRVYLGDQVDQNVNSGHALGVDLITHLKGPITSLDPLEIMQQPVLITADTINALNKNLNVFDSVAVSGLLSKNNTLKATRVMPLVENDHWKIRGFMSAISHKSFNIGDLNILNNSSAQFINCGAGNLRAGTLVEIKMGIDEDYVSGNSIKTLISVECLKTKVLSEHADFLPVAIQGFITEAMPSSDFYLQDIKVETHNTTSYENGERKFINDAISVEVQGVLNTKDLVLRADRIRFIENRVEVVFPVRSQDILFDSSIHINGLTFLKTPQTKDNMNILSEGLSGTRQVQILGYMDSEGNAYISNVSEKGMANFNNIIIRGQVRDLQKPLISIASFEVNVDNSTIIDQNNVVIDTETFFDVIKVGAQLEIRQGKYDESSNHVNQSIIFIKKTKPQEPIPITREIIGSGVPRGLARGTITRTADFMFASDFE